MERLVADTITIQVSVLLRIEPEPVIEATAAGATVTYAPTTDPAPGCD